MPADRAALRRNGHERCLPLGSAGLPNGVGGLWPSGNAHPRREVKTCEDHVILDARSGMYSTALSGVQGLLQPDTDWIYTKKCLFQAVE